MSGPGSRIPSPSKSNEGSGRSQSGASGLGNGKESRPRDPRRRAAGPKQPTQDELWKYWLQLADTNKKLEAKQPVPGYRPVDDESNDLSNLLEALLGLSSEPKGPSRGAVRKSGRTKRPSRASPQQRQRGGRPARSPNSGEIHFVIYVSDDDAQGENSNETIHSPPNLGEARGLFELIRSGSEQKERGRRAQGRRVADLAADSSESGKRSSGWGPRAKNQASPQMTWRQLEQMMRRNQTMLVESMRRQAEENWQQEADFTHEISQLIKDTQQEMMRALKHDNTEHEQRAKESPDADTPSTPPSSPSKM